MRRHIYIGELLIIGLLASGAVAQRQTGPSDLPKPAAPAPADLMQPETFAARRSTIQAELEALLKSDLPEEEIEKARAPYDDMLQQFAALDAAWQRQSMYTAQLAQLSEHFREVTTTQKKLETRPFEQFATVTEALRDRYKGYVQATQNEVQEILKQTLTGEARLAAIPKELEEYTMQRAQLVKRFEEARSIAWSNDQAASVVSDAARLALQLRVLEAEIQALSAEQEWLANRGALQDMLLKAAQTRLRRFQEELTAIQQALGTAIEQHQATLNTTAVQLERALEHATNVVEQRLLSEQLNTLRVRQATTEHRQRLNRLSHAVVAEEKRRASLQRNVDRLTSLFEKYASGASGGQRLLLAFERLRRERQRFQDGAIADIEAQVRVLTDAMFTLEDRLYDFDQQVEATLAEMQPDFQSATPQLQTALRQAFDEQKLALRERHQVLATLVQEKNVLLALHREYQRLLDDSYYTALSKMLWLRNSAPLNLEVLRQSLAGSIHVLTRVGLFLQTVSRQLLTRTVGVTYLWGLAIVLFVILPWIVYKLHAWLREKVKASLDACTQQDLPPGVGEALLIALRSALWPAYLAFVVWCYVQFLPAAADPFGLALGRSLLLAALILWGGFLGDDILRRHGWGEQCWQLSPHCCRFLRPLFGVACLAALLFLVPRDFVLHVSTEMEAATPGLALTRLLMLCFQTVILVLGAIAGWRNSPVMETLLARSRQQEGLWWRLWPSIYGLLLAGIVGMIGLDVIGYRYASQFIWLRTLESAFVLLLRRLLVMLLLLRVLHHLVDYLFSRRHFKRYPAAPETMERTFHVAYRLGSVLLLLLAVGAILEVWGVSASWFLTSSMGVTVLTRMTVIAMVIGLAIVVMQVSKAVSEYVLQPKADAPQTRTVSQRKFNTMVPLLHTLVKVGVIFVAVLVMLEQLNIATGPILAGVGIFGLAVGFASQSLIKDVINGLFILFEDSLSVGDVVSLRGASGVVEKVTLRAVTIRDLSGNVHVIPNSTLDMITNLTKDYGRCVIDIGVAYREDVDAVIELLREVDAEIFRDPEFGWDMLEPLEILGVNDFADSAMIIRTRVKTRPGQQWRVMREYRRRIKKAFDAHGIEIPFPHRTVYWGVPKEGQQSLPIALDSAPTPRPDNGARAEGKSDYGAPDYHENVEDGRNVS